MVLQIGELLEKVFEGGEGSVVIHVKFVLDLGEVLLDQVELDSHDYFLGVLVLDVLVESVEQVVAPSFVDHTRRDVQKSPIGLGKGDDPVDVFVPVVDNQHCRGAYHLGVHHLLSERTVTSFDHDHQTLIHLDVLVRNRDIVAGIDGVGSHQSADHGLPHWGPAETGQLEADVFEDGLLLELNGRPNRNPGKDTLAKQEGQQTQHDSAFVHLKLLRFSYDD